jgi:creatinine amidohydrolase
METSMMLNLFPDLVLPLSEAGEGKGKLPKIQGMKEGWAWAPRRWTQVTEDTGVGDPRQATVEKGVRYFDSISRKIGQFLVEFANADTENMYE